MLGELEHHFQWQGLIYAHAGKVLRSLVGPRYEALSGALLLNNINT